MFALRNKFHGPSLESERHCMYRERRSGGNDLDLQERTWSVPRSRGTQAGREGRTCSGRMKRARVRALRKSERSDVFERRESSRRSRQPCPATGAHARRECAGPAERSLKQETAETSDSQCNRSRNASDDFLTHRHSSSHRSRVTWPRPEVYRSHTPRLQSSRPRRRAKDR